MKPIPINSVRCPDCGQRVTYNRQREGARERQLERHMRDCPDHGLC